MKTDTCRLAGQMNLDLLRLQPALIAEVLKLERLAPGSGLAFVFQGYDGKSYRLASRNYPEPGRKPPRIQDRETIVALQNGNHFSAIQLVATGLGPDFGMAKRMELACAALAAIARLDDYESARRAA